MSATRRVREWLDKWMCGWEAGGPARMLGWGVPFFARGDGGRKYTAAIVSGDFVYDPARAVVCGDEVDQRRDNVAAAVGAAWQSLLTAAYMVDSVRDYEAMGNVAPDFMRRAAHCATKLLTRVMGDDFPPEMGVVVEVPTGDVWRNDHAAQA